MAGIILRKTHAYSISSDVHGHSNEADYLRCCHCQRFWKVEPGSGNQRGWCANCAAPHCGGPHCWECVPFMKQIEAQEARQRFLDSLL